MRELRGRPRLLFSLLLIAFTGCGGDPRSEVSERTGAATESSSHGSRPLPPDVSLEDASRALDAVYAALTPGATAPRGLATGPVFVWVTLWSPSAMRPARSIRASSWGVDLGDAAVRAALQARDEGLPWSDAGAARVQLDVPGLSAPVRRETLRAEYEPGIEGLLLRTSTGATVTQLPLDPLTGGWFTPEVRGRARKAGLALLHLQRSAGIDGRTFDAPGSRIERFAAVTFARAGVHASTVRTQRGRGPSFASRAEALAAAASWLGGRASSDGRFAYDLLPVPGGGTAEYNAVRHAGAVAGLYEVAASPHLPSLLTQELSRAAARGLHWLDVRIVPVPDSVGPPRGASAMAVIDDEGFAATGTAGFAWIAHLDGPREPRLEAGLAKFLLASVDAEGAVATGARISPRVRVGSSDGAGAGEEGDAPHPWFPGIVLLALARGYDDGRDPAWLGAAQRVARHRIAEHQAGRPIPDHWTIQGLVALDHAAPDPDLLRGALSMADSFLVGQYRALGLREGQRDYAGGFEVPGDVPRTLRAASRCEALGAAVEAARRLGVQEEPYLAGLRAAADHVQAALFGPHDGWYLPESDSVRGALRLGLVDEHVRIDGNKHAARCLLRALEVELERDSAPGRP